MRAARRADDHEVELVGSAHSSSAVETTRTPGYRAAAAAPRDGSHVTIDVERVVGVRREERRVEDAAGGAEADDAVRIGRRRGTAIRAPRRGSAAGGGSAGRSNSSPGLPASTTRPSSMNTTWSATLRAKPISWVTTSIVMPRCARPAMRLRTPFTSSGSSALVASSKSMTSGSMASARAIATRCCWPPERSRGRWSARSASPTSSRRSARDPQRLAPSRGPSRCAARAPRSLARCGRGRG